MQFSASSQKSTTEKSIFGNFEVIFLIAKNFPTAGWLFPVSTMKEEYLIGKISSRADLKKSYLFFRENTNFGCFRLSRSTFKVNFLNVPANFQKVIDQVPGRGC